MIKEERLKDILDLCIRNYICTAEEAQEIFDNVMSD